MGSQLRSSIRKPVYLFSNIKRFTSKNDVSKPDRRYYELLNIECPQIHDTFFKCLCLKRYTLYKIEMNISVKRSHNTFYVEYLGSK